MARLLRDVSGLLDSNRRCGRGMARVRGQQAGLRNSCEAKTVAACEKTRSSILICLALEKGDADAISDPYDPVGCHSGSLPANLGAANRLAHLRPHAAAKRATARSNRSTRPTSAGSAWRGPTISGAAAEARKPRRWFRTASSTASPTGASYSPSTPAPARKAGAGTRR